MNSEHSSGCAASLFFGLRFALCRGGFLGFEAAGLGVDFGLVAVEFEGLDRAAGLGDFFGGLLGELAGDDGELLGELAVAEDLDRVAFIADEALGDQGGGIDRGAGVEVLFEVADVDDAEVLAEVRCC